ncbi:MULTISPECIES: chemotaxis protein CheW [Sphingomonadales]|uniref:Chemotaxis protein CheW n=2 Tax=Edaphosphingomonas TaxID=3423724 RepID=A0A2T4I7B5_9SPHN|nr:MULTISPECIES: chemotaxis protein CheW [Sphingomonas]AGH49058.1 CheW protein [Sphingomonas sp. MM-1]MDX3885277.1 chemotaxis protein CheW [Sphingomonas sp.]OHT21479.1 Chemotaxis protein CheW [Sphingomonas haloaromaticamans]PTD26959.1 chemotaxis protein CheW [Sphingomonas fennica]
MSATDNSDERKIVTFTLGEQMFGIDMRALIEIREWEEPTPLPSVASYIKGVTNLRGSVVPVVGLAERLGWEPSRIHSRSCILVVSIGGRQAGFLVDEVADIVAINGGDIQPAPEVEMVEASMIAGLVKIERRAAEAEDAETMVLLLDLDALGLTRVGLDIAA